MIPAFTVVLVPFPFVERPQVKPRPALVVSSSRLEPLDLFWVAMITSRQEPHRAGDHQILDLAAAGLPVPSWIRASKITTLERRATLRTLGRLGREDQEGARRVLTECAGW